MSANKRNDTKIFEDETSDSGFISGPLDSCLESTEIEPEPESSRSSSKDSSDDKSVDDRKKSDRHTSTVKVEPQDGDSGLIDFVTDCLEDVNLCEPLAPQTFVCKISPPEKNTLPPFDIFFQPDEDGDTQLHIAAIHSCVKSVGTLIKFCPNKGLLDIPNDDGHTALHLSVMNRNPTVTRMLVHAGLSLAVRDRKGDTPLHKATAAGDVECLQALLAPVEDSPQTNLKPALNQKNYNGQACVHLAASAGHLGVLKILDHYKADINAQENLAGWSPLHIAARRGDTRMVQWLQRAGGHAGSRDYARRSPRRLARRTPAAALFAKRADSDTDTDSEDDMYDSEDGDSLFEALANSPPLVNVA